MTSGPPPVERLEETARRLEGLFPGLHVRFAVTMGRRASHVAGSVSDMPGEQLKVDISGDLAAFCSGKLPEDVSPILIALSELADPTPRHD